MTLKNQLPLVQQNKVYCSAPWKGITVRENGDVKTCCAGAEVIGNLKNNTIDEIINSNELQRIQTQMKNGTPGKNCIACVEQEKSSNHASLRHHYQKHYPFNDKELKLNFIDIRWNNRCNLACQYCGPLLSSTWQKRLGQPRDSAKNNYQDELLNWIISKSTEVNEIMMVGGEPMLMAQNHELLKQLPTNCQVSIITNLSYNLDTLRCYNDILNRPKEKIIWNVSGDNTFEQYEYVRSGSKWTEFSNNLKQICQIWNTTVCSTMVYSMFNAFDLLHIIKKYNDLGVNKFSLMQIADNPTVDVFNWPEQTQQIALDQLIQIKQWHSERFGEDAHLYPIDGLDNIILGLQNKQKCVKITYSKFCEDIAAYDRNRTASKFNKLWSHVWDHAKQVL